MFDQTRVQVNVSIYGYVTMVAYHTHPLKIQPVNINDAQSPTRTFSNKNVRQQSKRNTQALQRPVIGASKYGAASHAYVIGSLMNEPGFVWEEKQNKYEWIIKPDGTKYLTSIIKLCFYPKTR